MAIQRKTAVMKYTGKQTLRDLTGKTVRPGGEGLFTITQLKKCPEMFELVGEVIPAADRKLPATPKKKAKAEGKK